MMRRRPLQFPIRGRRTIALGLVGCALLTSCAPANREELTKQVLKADPEFSAVLEKRRELAKRIETYERELALKRSTVEHSIAQLRKDLAVATANVRSKISDVKKQMDPDRQRLKQAIAEASNELRQQQAERAAVGRKIAQLKKAAKEAGTAWTGTQRKKQDEQLDELLHDAERLDRELETLKDHLRLLKTKLLLIQL